MNGLIQNPIHTVDVQFVWQKDYRPRQTLTDPGRESIHLKYITTMSLSHSRAKDTAGVLWSQIAIVQAYVHPDQVQISCSVGYIC